MVTVSELFALEDKLEGLADSANNATTRAALRIAASAVMLARWYLEDHPQC